MKKLDEPNTEFDSPRPTLRGVPAVDPRAAAAVAAEVEQAKKDGGIITDYAEAMNTPEVKELLEQMRGIDQKREKSLMIVLSLLKKIKATEKNIRKRNCIDDEDTLVDSQPLNFAPTNQDWSAALKALDDTGAFECLSEPIHMKEDEAIIIDTPPAEELVEPNSSQAFAPARRSRPTREDLKAVVVNHEAKHGQLKMTPFERRIYRELVDIFQELPDADKKEIILTIKEERILAKIIQVLAEGEKIKTPNGKKPPQTPHGQAERTRAETRHTITLGKNGVKMEILPK